MGKLIDFGIMVAAVVVGSYVVGMLAAKKVA